DELRDLRFADDELRAVLDLLVLVGKAVRQGVPRVVGPLDDVDELFLEKVDDRHLRRSPGSGGKRRYFFVASRFASASPWTISASMRGAGSAPGMTEPSAKTRVGVAVTRSFCPSALVAATGLSQSPLFLGSTPESKNWSHAFTGSTAHQMSFALR